MFNKKENDEQNLCRECGSPLEPHAKFCGKCGWTVSNNPKNNKNPKKGKDKNKDDEKRYTVKIGPEGLDMRQQSDNDSEETVRLNISVPRSKRKEWKTMAAKLGESVSGLVREAMAKLQTGLENIESLEEFGNEMEELGKEIEKSFKTPKKSSEDKQRHIKTIKKRVKGLILLSKALPIEKLSQALGKSKSDAENLIYELVADGIEGTMEEGVFKFTNPPEEVISKLNHIIDKI